MECITKYQDMLENIALFFHFFTSMDQMILTLIIYLNYSLSISNG